MKKPDNVIFNERTQEYDAYKKEYPVSFSSKTFEVDKITNLKLEAQPYFKNRFLEIKNEYNSLVEKFEWNERICNAKFNFKIITGHKYYLYKNEEEEFLSIIKPDEWEKECIGTFSLLTNNTWQKID